MNFFSYLRRGQTAIILTLALPSLIAAAILGIDATTVFVTRIRLQRSVEAAVLAGAGYLPSNPSRDPNGTDVRRSRRSQEHRNCVNQDLFGSGVDHDERAPRRARLFRPRNRPCDRAHIRDRDRQGRACHASASRRRRDPI